MNISKIKRLTLLLFISFQLIGVNGIAQQHYDRTGLLFEDDEYEVLPKLANYTGTKFDEMPLQVSLIPYCPKPGNQGEILSCVGWAVGYGALTTQRAIQKGWTDRDQITRDANSAMFIYNQIKKGSCTQGANLSDALQFVTKNGDCLARDFDTNIADCSKKPNDRIKVKALEHSVADFVTLFSIKSAPDLKIKKVKEMLASKRPVIVGMNVRENFMKIKKATYWWPELGRTRPAGGHAMVVVGYDELKDAFCLLNSWGEDWGTDGFIWIKYEYFGKFCKYAYILNLTSKPSPATLEVSNPINEKTSVAGQFHFKYLDRSTRPFAFLDVPVQLIQKSVYKTETAWPIEQLFQLEVNMSSADEYVYVFSIDAQNKAEIHWPRDDRLNGTFENLQKSERNPNENTRICIPSKTSALQLTQPGKDYLFILFSKKQIPNIQQMVKRIQLSDKSNPLPVLEKGLHNKGLSIQAADYDKSQMSFITPSGTDNQVVPLILEVRSEK